MSTATEYTESGQATTGPAPQRAATAEQLARWQYTGEELEAQQAARDALMALPVFPDLERGLVGVFGPTAATFMMRDFRYWFSRPKMQRRWVAYIKAEQWKERMGLNRKQVNKGRAQLRAAGVVEEKLGPYKRIHYRINWVRLAELMALPIPLKGGQKADEQEGALLPPLKGGQKPTDTPKGGVKPFDTPPEQAAEDDKPHAYGPNGHQDSPETPKQGVQTNTGTYAGEYEQDIHLAGGAPAASQATQPAAPQPIKEENLKGQGTVAPTHQQPRHPATSDTAAQQASKEAGGSATTGGNHTGWPKPAPEPPQLDRLERHQVWQLLLDEHDSIPHRFACAHLRGATAGGAPVTVEVVAEKVREARGSKHPTAAYMDAVQRAVQELHYELQPAPEPEPARAAV